MQNLTALDKCLWLPDNTAYLVWSYHDWHQIRNELRLAEHKKLPDATEAWGSLELTMYAAFARFCRCTWPHPESRKSTTTTTRPYLENDLVTSVSAALLLPLDENTRCMLDSYVDDVGYPDVHHISQP